ALASLSSFHGIIANFDEGESIRITGAVSASLDITGTHLMVYDALNNLQGTLDLSTSYAGDTFNVTNGVITVVDLAVTLDSTTATQGSTIHVTAVTDDGTSVLGSVSYSWQVSNDNFASFTVVGVGSSYTPNEDDEGKLLRLVTTYSADPSGSEINTTNFGTVADITLAFSTAASISGTAKEGSTLTAVDGTPNDNHAA